MSQFTLPKLEFAFDALEPHIDAVTMEIHHTKHHQAYIDKLNTALEGQSELEALSIEDLMTNLDQVPMEIETTVRNNGGGHANHSLFWRTLSPKKTKVSAALNNQINKDIGDMDKLEDQMFEAALGQFGSGWAWLSLEQGKLHVCSTPNQDNPFMKGSVPILGVDVWEHAYYLKYQNKRADYLAAWWKVVDWQAVSELFEQAQTKTLT